MKIPEDISFEVVPQTLVFKEPATTSRGVYQNRHVWYVYAKSNLYPNNVGVGECAPLPKLSCDDIDDYESVLRYFLKKISLQKSLDYDSLRNYPSILFGIETALLNLERGSLALFDTPFSRGEVGIKINGLVWMGSFDEMYSRLESKIASGFDCIKVKIGSIDLEREMSLIEGIRERFEKSLIEIRVDANGAFNSNNVGKVLSTLANLQVHSIEQPIRAGNWSQMADICVSSPLPIALDEELIGVNTVNDKRRLLDVIKPNYIVLKPSLHGGMYGCNEWIALAKERNIGYWITSALESNIGLNAIAQWCATKDSDMPQGLGTGLLFEKNVDVPLHIKGNMLWFQ